MTQYETSDLIRIAPGHIGQTTLLSNADYLLTNFDILDDMKYPYWLGHVDGAMRDGVIIQSLSGFGRLYGKLSGTLTLALFTPDMQQYWFVNVMQSRHIAPVTLYLFHPRLKETTINCYLRWFENIADGGTQQTDTDFTNVTLNWNRGTITGGAYSSAYSEAYD